MRPAIMYTSPVRVAISLDVRYSAALCTLLRSERLSPVAPELDSNQRQVDIDKRHGITMVLGANGFRKNELSLSL
jgi:hypothetical protein